MGMAHSALYRHFRNRDPLLSAMLELIRTKLSKNGETVRQKRDDAVKRLRVLLFRHVRLIKERHGIPKIFFFDEVWGQNQERRRKMFRIVSGYLAEIEAIIRESQDNGQVREEIAPRAPRRCFTALCSRPRSSGT
ncbi:MAG TPA: hypothetical protein DDY20_10765 [Desulfobulbaceae bacterium]|nr:hypothetical protein [Desulfobulbaceae bacterium]